MNRTRFEDTLIRNANDAHEMSRTNGVPAILGVPLYLSGYAFGRLVQGASVFVGKRAAR